MMLDQIAITLAQTSDQILSGGAPAPVSGGVAPAGGAGGPPAGSMFGPLMLMTLIIGTFIVLQILAGRRDKKKRAAMMEGLRRGNKVLTIGGQIGVVDQVLDHEVVLKVDENSNAKMRFTKSAIQSVMDSGPSTEASNLEVKTRVGDKVTT